MQAVVGKFERIGARARVLTGRPGSDFKIDVAADKRGEVFALHVPEDIGIEVLDARAKDRHLLLLVRAEPKQRFLCGHDERHWFAAAIPESAPVSTVAGAKDALKPLQARRGERAIRTKLRGRRRNPAYVRQGEWFFVPAPDVEVEEWHILRDEPLTRGRGSTPHVVEEAVRMGGETVYVTWRYPDGLSVRDHERLVRRLPQALSWRWQIMKRNPEVLVRGRVRHPDHRTVVLRGWHRVYMNTEGEARARSSVAFLD